MRGEQTTRDLVPGDPAAVWELAHSFATTSVALAGIGLGFRTIDDGGWRGPAADAFHASLDQQPTRFLAAADAFTSAAVALDTYASVLAWAQRQAGEAIAAAREEPGPGAARPVRTAKEQAELTGVVAYGYAEPAPAPTVPGPVVAAGLLRRAKAQLDVAGDGRAVSPGSAAGCGASASTSSLRASSSTSSRVTTCPAPTGTWATTTGRAASTSARSG